MFLFSNGKKMKRLFSVFTLVFSIVLFSACGEETYTTKSLIYGVVIEATDNTPIEGVLVTNETTGKNCITKADGYYEFQDLQFNKTYKIRAEKEGYIPSPQSITPSELRDKIELNIKLSRRP